MFTTGFTMNAKPMAEPKTGNSIQWLKNRRRKNCAITGSVIIEEDGNYSNRLIWVTPDEIKSYDKRHLFLR